MIIVIEPGSPAYGELAEGIDEGKKISIDRRRDGVAIKIGEGMWSPTLLTTPPPTVYIRDTDSRNRRLLRLANASYAEWEDAGRPDTQSFSTPRLEAVRKALHRLLDA